MVNRGAEKLLRPNVKIIQPSSNLGFETQVLAKKKKSPCLDTVSERPAKFVYYL